MKLGNTLNQFLKDKPQAETPAYVYDFDIVADRLKTLSDTFCDLFKISYALKSNPNQKLLNALTPLVDMLDASSFNEVTRSLNTGIAPALISYSGPGKRNRELAGVLGTGIALVVEALDEVETIGALAAKAGQIQDVVLRVNPDFVPRSFGASMAGHASQFGVDQNQMKQAIDLIQSFDHLNLIGFHIYTGSNSLNVDGISENILSMKETFIDATEHAGITPRKLIFGAGFGLPYHTGQEPLDIAAVKAAVAEGIAELKSRETFQNTDMVLELGRWLVGPAGALLTSVLSRKTSNGSEVAICDAGFNNHLAACGMMGAVFQKNWPIVNVTSPDGTVEEYKITGPLCTSIDSIARKIDMPSIKRGDVLAILMSGAYGLTASPTRFISHPEPQEYLFKDGSFANISESALNHPSA